MKSEKKAERKTEKTSEMREVSGFCRAPEPKY